MPLGAITIPRRFGTIAFMNAHIFHLRLPTGPIVRGIRVLAEEREQAAARVFRMYPRSTEYVEAEAAAVHTNGAGTPAFLVEV